MNYGELNSRGSSPSYHYWINDIKDRKFQGVDGVGGQTGLLYYYSFVHRGQPFMPFNENQLHLLID